MKSRCARSLSLHLVRGLESNDARNTKETESKEVRRRRTDSLFSNPIKFDFTHSGKQSVTVRSSKDIFLSKIIVKKNQIFTIFRIALTEDFLSHSQCDKNERFSCHRCVKKKSFLVYHKYYHKFKIVHSIWRIKI